MNEFTPAIIRIHPHGYCAEGRGRSEAIRSVAEGVRIIREILQRSVLCRHDVENMNHAYRAIDLLEKGMEQIPSPNSSDALRDIITKVERISQAQITPDGLITLYHLRKFSEGELRVQEHFNRAQTRFITESKQIEVLAERLPCCHSEVCFNEDVEGLLGSDVNSKAAEILNFKREKLQKYEKIRNTLNDRKTALQQQRKDHPDDYPAYYDELLDNGYLHLYDHLNAMRVLANRNERYEQIRRMSFSQASHVILEVREAVMQKVMSAISVDQRSIIFLVGGTGGGKTTTFCFLRGDTMVENHSNYRSLSDNGQLIGHDEAKSCTFLPLIGNHNGMVLVDFPGRNDTHGRLVSLGIELAFKALINKYNPRVVVIDAITNKENKFEAAAELGSYLDRVLANKECCILGITKYVQDPDYNRVRTIEEQQIKDLETQKRALLEPTPEERGLQKSIERLCKLNQSNLSPTIEDLKQELKALEEQRAQTKVSQILPETDEKIEGRKRIRERENELKKQVGLSRVIQLCDLNEQTRASCRALLSDPSIANAATHVARALSSDDERMLDTLFANLMQEIERKTDYHLAFKNFEDFEKSVLETSLIQTLFSQTNPEIGQLLVLPEIDSRLIRKYDRQIVSDCIKAYMIDVISLLNLTRMQTVLDEMTVMKVSASMIADLNLKLVRARTYIMGLLGLSIPEEEQSARAAWNKIYAEHQRTVSNVEESYRLSPWTKIALGLPVGVPYGIYAFVRYRAISNATRESFEKTLTKCCVELDQMYEVLMRLKAIEKVIMKQDQIDAELKESISVNQDLRFVRRIKQRINNIKLIYGHDHWDQQVNFLIEKFKLRVGLKTEVEVENAISAFSYFFCEPEATLTSEIRGSSPRETRLRLIKNLGDHDAVARSDGSTALFVFSEEIHILLQQLEFLDLIEIVDAGLIYKPKSMKPIMRIMIADVLSRIFIYEPPPSHSSDYNYDVDVSVDVSASSTTVTICEGDTCVTYSCDGDVCVPVGNSE